MAVRADRTGFGEIEILQDPEGFCYGVDAVLLAGYARQAFEERGREPERLMDLGTGTGIVPLILSHTTGIPDLRGLERNPESFALAERNVERNGLEGRVRFYLGDAADEELPAREGLQGIFDAVTTNPPYVRRGAGTGGLSRAKAEARQETTAGLREFLLCARRMLREKGELFLVYRPERLTELCICGRETGMETKELLFVSGHAGEAPNLLLARLVRGGRPGVKIREPLAVREIDGSYTPEMRALAGKD